MKLTLDDVQHIAKLARLSLTGAEIKKYTEDLSVVFEYVDMLGDVETEGVEETCQVTGLEDVVRDDVVILCDEEVKKKIVDQFPESEGDLLKVKAVFNSAE